MPPSKGTEAKVTLIDNLDEWAKISGEKAAKDMLAVVELFTEWCGPTQAIVAARNKMAKTYTGRKIEFYMASCCLGPWEFGERGDADAPGSLHCIPACQA